MKSLTSSAFGDVCLATLALLLFLKCVPQTSMAWFSFDILHFSFHEDIFSPRGFSEWIHKITGTRFLFFICRILSTYTVLYSFNYLWFVCFYFIMMLATAGILLSIELINGEVPIMGTFFIKYMIKFWSSSQNHIVFSRQVPQSYESLPLWITFFPTNIFHSSIIHFHSLKYQQNHAEYSIILKHIFIAWIIKAYT